MENSVKCRRCKIAIPPSDLSAIIAQGVWANVQAMMDLFPFNEVERAILPLVIEGMHYRDIADRLGWTQKSAEQKVKNRMTDIFTITGCESRHELQARFVFGPVPDRRRERTEYRLRCVL